MHTDRSCRRDAAVPEFADDKVVFDGEYVICSAWVQFALKHDKAARYRFLVAQSPLGEALYRRYGLDGRDYESNILAENGQAFFKSQGSIG
jgi:predicted DCC family thiol-disulfide oxidoreductase YuxK